jgi:hypothetical protein
MPVFTTDSHVSFHPGEFDLQLPEYLVRSLAEDFSDGLNLLETLEELGKGVRWPSGAKQPIEVESPYAMQDRAEYPLTPIYRSHHPSVSSSLR